MGVREREFVASLESLPDIRSFVLEEDGAEGRLPPRRAAHMMSPSRRSS